MTNKLLISLLSASIFSVAASTVVAETPSFNYAEVGYASYDDLGGLELRGAIELNDMFYISGSFVNLSDDEDESEASLFGAGADLNYARIGIGAKFPINDTTLVYSQAQFLRRDVSFDLGNSTVSIEDNGYALAGGIRTLIADTTELYGELAHENIDNHDTSLALGIRQSLTENFGLYAEYKKVDADTSANLYSVGARFTF